MEKSKKSIVNIIEGIVIAIMILLIASMLFLYFSFSKSGTAPNLFGYTIYHTKAVNMEPEIPAESAVIAKASEIENIKVGSAILCKIGEDTVLTRVVQLLNENGEMSYVVKFDTAPANNTFKIPSENVIAKAIWTSTGLGSLLSFATSTFGIMLVIIIPSFIIIVFQIIRIINAKHAEEDAYSLDDLNEIMIDNSTPTQYAPPVRKTEPTAQLKPIKQIVEPKEISKKEVLNIDKNGKAGLTSADASHSPLFSYDSIDVKTGKPKEAPEKPAEKTIKTPTTDAFFNNYVEDKNRDQLYGDRIKRQEIVPDTEEQQSEPAQEKKAFMSNVLPEKLSDTVQEAEQPPKPAAPAHEPAPKPVHADKVIKNAQAIPPKAVVPKENLTPPPKRNTSKTISELMSIIDAEESKLR